jgi:hypothetical protein
VVSRLITVRHRERGRMDDWSNQLEDEIVGVRESRRLGWAGWPVKTVSILVVLMLTGVGIVVAVTLFTHNFPSFTPPGGVLSTTCATVAVQNSESNGLIGSVVWGCGAADEALVVGQGTVTYLHTAPIGAGADQYTSLYIVEGPKPVPIDNCVTGWGSSRLINPTTGTQIFAAGDVGDWWYCAEFTGIAQKTTFTVTWSQ